METLSKVKATIRIYLPDSKVLLFGSRARGDSTISSDYDVMIITKETYAAKEKINFMGKIRKILISILHAPVDVFINSEEEISEKRKLPGHIVQYALEEGIEL